MDNDERASLTEARREAMDYLHGKERPGGLDGRFAGPLGLVRALVAAAENREAVAASAGKAELIAMLHDQRLFKTVMAVIEQHEDMGPDFQASAALSVIRRAVERGLGA